MYPCPTTRESCFPTHRSPCRLRRSSRHRTILAATPAVCQSPPDPGAGGEGPAARGPATFRPAASRRLARSKYFGDRMCVADYS